jgi:hypothetical protein
LIFFIKKNILFVIASFVEVLKIFFTNGKRQKFYRKNMAINSVLDLEYFDERSLSLFDNNVKDLMVVNAPVAFFSVAKDIARIVAGFFLCVVYRCNSKRAIHLGGFSVRVVSVCSFLEVAYKLYANFNTIPKDVVRVHRGIKNNAIFFFYKNKENFFWHQRVEYMWNLVEIMFYGGVLFSWGNVASKSLTLIGLLSLFFRSSGQLLSELLFLYDRSEWRYHYMDANETDKRLNPSPLEKLLFSEQLVLIFKIISKCIAVVFSSISMKHLVGSTKYPLLVLCALMLYVVTHLVEVMLTTYMYKKCKVLMNSRTMLKNSMNYRR